MTITYEDAIKAVVSAEEGLVDAAASIIENSLASLQGTLDEITDLRSSFPAVNGYNSSTRSTVESVMSTIQSYASQLTYTKATLANLKSQYTTVAPSVIPSTTPSYTPPADTQPTAE